MDYGQPLLLCLGLDINMVQKGLAYFLLGFVAGLIVVELTNGKPPVKVNHPVNIIYKYDYLNRPIYRQYWEHQFNPYSRGSRSGSNNGSNDEGRTTGITDAGTQSFNHNSQERQESWGNKN